MLSFIDSSPDGLARRFAERIRERRLARGWSRVELSARSGVAVPTLRKFEDTGQISFTRLLKLAGVLGLFADFEHVASSAAPARSLADLDVLHVVRRRQRGRTLKRDAP
jgi:transcriptional regulator with XRE-family HTH domain